MEFDEGVAMLEDAVMAQRYDKGIEIAQAVDAITGVYPADWQPVEGGIKWQGFVMTYDSEAWSFGNKGAVIVRVKRESHIKRWFGPDKHEVYSASAYVQNAADMLRVLSHHEPAPERTDG